MLGRPLCQVLGVPVLDPSSQPVDHGPVGGLVATKGHFDSLAVEAGGAVVVAAIGEGLCVVQVDGGHDYVALPDRFTTNVCFGGDDMQTAYATLSGSGRLVALDWPRPGLKLAF